MFSAWRWLRSIFLRISDRTGAALDSFLGYDFFISYSHKDGADYPRRLAERLTERRFRVFFDEHDYVAGDDLKTDTSRRVGMSSYLVVVAREHAWRSGWVTQEVRTALEARRTAVALAMSEQALSDNRTTAVGSFLIDRLSVFDPDGLAAGQPSIGAVDDLQRAFRARRQETMRIVLAISMFTVLTITAATASWQYLVASSERASAETQSRASQALLLAALSREQRDSNPSLSVRLASAGHAVTRNTDDPTPLAVDQALRDSMLDLGGVAIAPDPGQDYWLRLSDSLRWMADGDDDPSTMELRDLKSTTPARVVRRFDGLPSRPLGVIFTPDDRWMVAGRWGMDPRDLRDGEPWLWIWDLHEAGSPAVALSIPTDLVIAMFDTNSQRLVATGADRVFIWELSSREWNSPRVLPLRRAAHAVALSPVRGLLAVLAATGEGEIIDLDVRANIAPRRTVVAGKFLHRVLFTPDAATLVGWNADDGDVLALQVDSSDGAFRKVFQARAPLTRVQMSDDGRWLAGIGSFDGFFLIELQTTRLRAQLYAADRGYVNDVAFSRDGSWLATASGGRMLREFEFRAPKPEMRATLWKLGGGVLQHQLDLAHPSEVVHLAFGPDSSLLFTSTGAVLKRWSIAVERFYQKHENADLLQELEPVYGKLGEAGLAKKLEELSAEFGLQGDTLAAGLPRQGLTGRGHSDPIAMLYVSADGTSLLTWSRREHDPVRLWDARAGTWSTTSWNLTQGLSKFEGRSAPRLSRDARYVAFTDYRGLGIVDTQKRTYQLLAAAPNTSSESEEEDERRPAIAFSPDSRSLAALDVGSRPGLQMWSLREGRAEAIDLATQAVDMSTTTDPRLRHMDAAPVWTGDSKLFVVTSHDLQRVLLTDRRSASNASRTFNGPGGSIRAVASSHGGRWLAVGTTEGRIRLWDLHSDDPARMPSDLSLSPGVKALRFSADDRWLVGENENPDFNRRRELQAEIRLWPLGPLTPPTDARAQRIQLSSESQVDLDERGVWLTVATPRSPLRLFDLRRSAPNRSWRTPFPSEKEDGMDLHLRWSPDGSWLTHSKGLDEIELAHFTPRGDVDRSYTIRGELIRSLRRYAGIEVQAFSPDGRWLAIKSDPLNHEVAEDQSSVLRLFDLHATDPTSSSLTIPMWNDRAYVLSFSADTALLAVASSDRLDLVPVSTTSLLPMADAAAGGPLSDIERRTFGISPPPPIRSSVGGWLVKHFPF